jgi:outer membrane protein assembly factor BamE
MPLAMMRADYMTTHRPRRTALALIALAFLLSACIYRIDIQQGNFLESKDTDQISVGMTRSQVQYALGTPMVADPFNNARWDYIYYLKKGRWQRAERRNFTVYFEDNKVARIEKSGPEGKTTPPKT